MRAKLTYYYGVVLACSTVFCASVSAQTSRTGLDVATEAGATSNPYLTDDDTRLIGVGKVEVRPWLRVENERDSVQLTAFFIGRAFSGNYDFEDSEGAALSVRSKRSERLTLYGAADVSSSSARSVFPWTRPVPGVTDPIDPVDPGMPLTQPTMASPSDDITLLGVGGRSTSLSISSGLTDQLDERSLIGFDVGYQRLTVEDSTLTDYDSANAVVTYLRRLSPQTSAGIRAGAGKAVYDGGGNATTFLVEGSIDHRIAERWHLTGSAGVSTTRNTRTAILPAGTATGLTGALEICNTIPRRDFCVTYDRSQSPGARGRTRTVDAIGLRLSQRVSVRDRIDVNARYSRSAPVGSAIEVIIPAVEIAGIDARFSRTIGERTEAYVFGTFARAYGTALSDEPSLSAGVGIRFKLGRNR